MDRSSFCSFYQTNNPSPPPPPLFFPRCNWLALLVFPWSGYCRVSPDSHVVLTFFLRDSGQGNPFLFSCLPFRVLSRKRLFSFFSPKEEVEGVISSLIDPLIPGQIGTFSPPQARRFPHLELSLLFFEKGVFRSFPRTITFRETFSLSSRGVSSFSLGDGRFTFFSPLFPLFAICIHERGVRPLALDFRFPRENGR